MIENPDVCISNSVALLSGPLFPVCAVSHAQTCKLGDLLDPSDCFMNNTDRTSPSAGTKENASVAIELYPYDKSLTLSVDKEQLTTAQESDVTLSFCWSREKFSR